VPDEAIELALKALALIVKKRLETSSV